MRVSIVQQQRRRAAMWRNTEQPCFRGGHFEVRAVVFSPAGLLLAAPAAWLGRPSRRPLRYRLSRRACMSNFGR
ncbi:hypothetical protein MRX96_055920 [Rhipicephalus microplus]